MPLPVDTIRSNAPQFELTGSFDGLLDLSEVVQCSISGLLHRRVVSEHVLTESEIPESREESDLSPSAPPSPSDLFLHTDRQKREPFLLFDSV